MEGEVADVRIRPLASHARAALVASLIAGAPLFGVLYWLSAVQGSWRRVLVLHAVVLVLGAVLWLRYRASCVSVTPTQLTITGLFSRRTVPRSTIASAVIAHTWRPGSLDSIPQLLVLGSAGRCLARLEGSFWSSEGMRTVAEGLDVPFSQTVETVSLAELHQEHPSSRRWFERRPWIAVVGVVLAFAIAFAVISWVMTAIGAPPGASR